MNFRSTKGLGDIGTTWRPVYPRFNTFRVLSNCVFKFEDKEAFADCPSTPRYGLRSMMVDSLFSTLLMYALARENSELH